MSRLLVCFTVSIFPVVIVVISLLTVFIEAASLPEFSPGPRLLRLAVDSNTSTIYVGAVNHVYQLTADNLRLTADVNTGPMLDNRRCYEPGTFGLNPCNSSLTTDRYEAKQTDNYNQVLVFDATRRQLITCGSIFQGVCQTRSLVDISLYQTYTGLTAGKNLFVANNDPDWQTVAFLGPGPTNDTVLYVASDFTDDQKEAIELRQNATGISSRRLSASDTFQLVNYVNDVESASTSGTFAMVNVDAAVRNRVRYVDGFSWNGFSYFVTVQQLVYSAFTTSSASSTGSKIVQVCQNDPLYNSYVEMPIVCRSSTTNYTHIEAVTVFRPGRDSARALGIDGDVLIGAFYSPDGAKSALCLFQMRDIRAKVAENHRYCSDNPNEFVGQQFVRTIAPKCSQNPALIDADYCGQQVNRVRNSPLSGNISVQSQTFKEFDDIIITAVSSLIAEQHTVLFAGTADGRLFKLLLNAPDYPVFDTVIVASTPSPINRNIIVMPSRTHVIAMSNSSVFKIPTADCGRFNSCDTCVEARSPFCGWCTLLARCVTRNRCANWYWPTRWLTVYNESSNRCIRIVDVSPSSGLSIAQDINISLQLEMLPALRLNESYNCVLSPSNQSTRAVYSNNHMTCRFPPRTITASFLGNHTNITLIVQAMPTGVGIIHTQLALYNCSSYANCASCASSAWNCSWCIHEGQCVDAFTTCRETSARESEFCPRLAATKEIMIQSGTQRTIDVNVLYLPVLPAEDGGDFYCHLSMPSEVIILPATRRGNTTIVCSIFNYFNLDSNPKHLDLAVGWMNNSQFDGKTNVTVFNCSMMSDNDDCSTCHSLQYGTYSRFDCRWCDNSCTSGIANCVDSTCPLPTVTSIHPISGPIDGGTRVTISGTNLGFQFNHSSVLIAEAACHVTPDEYIVSKRIVCVTSRVPGVRVSFVNITVNRRSIVWNDGVNQPFHYVNPLLSDKINPTKGPRDGGTVVTLYGDGLNAGSNLSVYFGGRLVTNLLQVSVGEVIFATPSVSSRTAVTNVSILIDNSTRRHASITYTYVNNPVIGDLNPKSSSQSGGCALVVSGSNMDSSNNVRMQLVGGAKGNFTLTPVNVTSNQLVFLSPYAQTSMIGPFTVSFIMDGVEGVRSLPPRLAVFNITADPEIETFKYIGERISLKGKRLLTPCIDRKSEITILIGSEICEMDLVLENELQCTPPEKQPLGRNEQGELDSRILPHVYMTMGNFTRDLGPLRYQTISPPTTSSESKWWPIIVGVIGGVLVVTIVVLVVVFMRKTWYNKRLYRRLQSQLDALESSVRQECKEAFAELQTEVLDIATEVGADGVPFWDYNTYCMKLLFPFDREFQLLQHSKTSVSYSEQMRKFELLLNSKFFLLVFINTLEQQNKNFTSPDKSRFASLLMVALGDKMDYITSVMKPLLSQLIQKSVESKRAKVMLRTHECVVEKLLANWLALSLYDNISQGPAGQALFMLFQAIKRQTEKGPVDVMTGEARYCLREDHLLREKIEPNVLTVTVLSSQDDVSEHQVSADSTCKMLDCDTISQAKAKAIDFLYVNTPFSLRPKVDEVDLVWLSSRRDRLPLSDDDVTTRSENGWRRVNTLSHYHIPDNSTFLIDTRRSPSASGSVGTLITRTPSGMLELDTGTSTLRPIRIEDCPSARQDQTWHLTKNSDDNNGPSNAGRSNKVISEIFLTRLLSTKMTLQRFIDDLFDSILLPRDSSVPICIKYLFDLFDASAKQHGITDPDVVHHWKTNSLPLRFWVNVVQNPDFVFDVEKTPIVDSCLKVIGQTLIDSCSTHEHILSKDSPTNKLLFAKDIPRYRKQLMQFYNTVQQMEPLSEEEVMKHMLKVSNVHTNCFNQDAAVQMLFQYAYRYRTELCHALENNSSARNMQLSSRFEQLMSECSCTDSDIV